MSHAQPASTVQVQSGPPRKPWSPTGLVFQTWQKGLLLVFFLGILYVRLWRRKQTRTVVCSHCGKKNPPHLLNCQKCAAPLMQI